MTKIKASDNACIVCKEQAVAFFPVFEPDIPSNPYCRKCLDKLKLKLVIELSKFDKDYE